MIDDCCVWRDVKHAKCRHTKLPTSVRSIKYQLLLFGGVRRQTPCLRADVFNSGASKCNGIAQISKKDVVVERTAEQNLSESVIPNDTREVNILFSDVGTVTKSVTEETRHPWSPFNDMTPIQMLERPRFIASMNWLTSSTGYLYTVDIWNELIQDVYNMRTLRQFKYLRSDVEVSIRVNGGQMYSGALMCTLYPGTLLTGCQYLEQRAVLNPGIISAATQNTITLTLPFSTPTYWVHTAGDTFDAAVRLTLDVLAPLRANSPTIPDHVTVIVTARFVNPRVAWPIEDQSLIELQSNPSQDATNYKGPRGEPSFGDVITRAISSSASAIITPENLASLAKLALTVLDKPESTKETTNAVLGQSMNSMVIDRPDYSVPNAYRSDSYLSTTGGIFPGQRDWTTSMYAQIPGLVGVTPLTNSLTVKEIDLLSRSPYEHMRSRHAYTKGGRKVLLQFFCSAFVSGRFCLRYVPESTIIGNWENETTRVVDVNGDTMVNLTLPYIGPYQFAPSTLKTSKLLIERLTDITSNNAGSDPGISLVVWVAGAEDVQFAVPQRVNVTSANFTVPIPPFSSQMTTDSRLPVSRKTSELAGLRISTSHEVEKQSFPGDIFKSSFDPIVHGAEFLIDDHLCMSETTGLFTDLLKRYNEGAAMTTFSPSIYVKAKDTQNWHGPFFALFPIPSRWS